MLSEYSKLCAQERPLAVLRRMEHELTARQTSKASYYLSRPSSIYLRAYPVSIESFLWGKEETGDIGGGEFAG